MSLTIKSDGGITVRLLETLRGFRANHGYWPLELHAREDTIAALATKCLTPLGFYLLQLHIEVKGSEHDFLAKGNEDEAFNYGDEHGADEPVTQRDVCEWLGFSLT